MPENGTISRDGTLIDVVGLEKHFPVARNVFAASLSAIHAVDRVSFQVPWGVSFGLVGESGCGKTTTGKLIARLLQPTGGHIYVMTMGMARLIWPH